MTSKTATVTMLLLALVLGLPTLGLAAPIPEYFQDGSVGFFCLNATPPGSGPTTVFVQVNFDQKTFGGIPLSRADALFAYLTGRLGLLSPVTGNNPQQTCQYTPSQIQVMFPGATALQAAQQVSPIFQQLGYARFMIVDVFLSFAVLYSGSVDTVRAEVFLVPGSNDLNFAMGIDLVETLVP